MRLPAHPSSSLRKVCADQLSTIITSILNPSLQSHETLNSWKCAIIQVCKPSQLKHCRPMYLTSILWETMGKLIKQCVISNTQMDLHQYAYDTINNSIHMPKLTHLDINLSNWIAIILSDRTQRTSVNGKLSKSC